MHVAAVHGKSTYSQNGGDLFGNRKGKASAEPEVVQQRRQAVCLITHGTCFQKSRHLEHCSWYLKENHNPLSLFLSLFKKLQIALKPLTLLPLHRAGYLKACGGQLAKRTLGVAMVTFPFLFFFFLTNNLETLHFQICML